jgi:hypothetical protein
MTNGQPCDTPMQHNCELSEYQGFKDNEEIEQQMGGAPYRQAMGIGLYIALGTRPDIVFAVTKLSQYCTNPGAAHWNAGKHL